MLFRSPWTAPVHDSIDGRGLYAAKSAPWSGRRLFFGWIASRRGERDDGEWLWAGTMAALEAVPREDGSLRLRIPPEVLDRYGRAAWSLPAFSKPPWFVKEAIAICPMTRFVPFEYTPVITPVWSILKLSK